MKLESHFVWIRLHNYKFFEMKGKEESHQKKKEDTEN